MLAPRRFRVDRRDCKKSRTVVDGDHQLAKLERPGTHGRQWRFGRLNGEGGRCFCFSRRPSDSVLRARHNSAWSLDQPPRLLRAGPLFRRTHRAVQITPAGRALAEATGRAFAELLRASEPLAGAQATARLRLSVSPLFALAWLMPRLPAFMATIRRSN